MPDAQAQRDVLTRIVYAITWNDTAERDEVVATLTDAFADTEPPWSTSVTTGGEPAVPPDAVSPAAIDRELAGGAGVTP